MTETLEERSARFLRELESLGGRAEPMAGCKVCGENVPRQRYPGQLCSKSCRAEQRKRTRKENKR